MKDEWIELQKEFPTVAFNYKNFNGQLNDTAHGFEHIYIAEPFSVYPEQWNPRVLQQYKTVITYNEKFYNQYNHLLNMKLVKGCLWCNYELNNIPESKIPSFKKKKEAAIILNKNYRMNSVGEITWLRPEVANNMSYRTEVFSPTEWGANYMGNLASPLHHSHTTQLKKLAEYRFCICFESMHHQFWSHGFMTERLFNCLKVRTIPIYIGCHNIEDYVPKEFFIDFRDYYSEGFRDYDRLSADIASISEDAFDEITEQARVWNTEHKIGSVKNLRELLKSIT